jgi:hypothetical protein
VATASEADVSHDADPLLSVPEQRVEPPELKMTVPVAPAGRPLACKLTAVPNVVVLGVADAENEVVALVIVKLVAAVEPA